MKPFKENHIREATLKFKNGKYITKDSDIGLYPFERSVELPWLNDKVGQINLSVGDKLLDFGCNKAKYIKSFKNKYGLITHGIDAKKSGSKFVDYFYGGVFNDKLDKRIRKKSPFSIGTSISAIEHAGCSFGNEKKTRKYQKHICKFMIDVSECFFLSVPFGSRPGWANDKSRTNFYQFDALLLDFVKEYAKFSNMKYMEEFYLWDGLYWNISERQQNLQCKYRDKKSGATSVALISIWNH